MAKKVTNSVRLYQSGVAVKSTFEPTEEPVILKPIIVALQKETPCGKVIKEAPTGSEPRTPRAYKTNYDKLVWSDFDELAEHLGRFLTMVFEDTSGQFDPKMETADLVEACFDWLDEEATPTTI